MVHVVQVLLSSAAVVREMSMVRGMRGVGGVCEMCIFGSGRCGWRGDEWLRGFGLSFTNPVETG